MEYINNLGTYNNLKEVWDAYPLGGIEGDYVIVEGQKVGWDKFSQSWGNTDSTPAQELTLIDGDLRVTGTIRAHNLKGLDKGLWPTSEALKIAIPTPEVGFWAAVGNGFPATVWVCKIAGVWENSGTTYDGGGVSLENYVTRNDIKAALASMFIPVESEEVLRDMLASGNYDESKIYYVVEE